VLAGWREPNDVWPERHFWGLTTFPRVTTFPRATLIIPRRHVGSAFDLTEDEITSVLHLIQAARERIDRTHEPAGHNVGVNVGREAGQKGDARSY
jgi:HIT domain